MLSPAGKIIQLFYIEGMCLCLTSEGHIFRYDPVNNYYEYLNRGLEDFSV